ncbi:MAG: HlyD family efflux transporter periplasmic adaptor subunit [Bdellovibrionales bacterium]|nr:HlyD family efflux transporter periplasmic adaptor subunit [Bdellovibrionales bacterium]
MTRKQSQGLWSILNQVKEFYPMIIIYSAVVSFLTLATPISVQSLVNTFTFGPYFQPLFILSLLLLGVLSLLGFVKSLQYFVVEAMQRRLYAKLTLGIVRSFLAEKAEGRERSNNLQLANRYFDIVVLQKALSFLVTDGVAVLLQTAIGLVLISLYHPYFILLSLLILISIYFSLFFSFQGALDTSVEESTSKYEVAAMVEGVSASQVEPNNPEEIAKKLERADHLIGRWLERRSSHFKILFRQHILFMVQFAVLNATLLGLGGYLVITNQLTVGQLVAAEIVVNAILSKFLFAKKYLETFYDMFAAAQKLNLFYEQIEDSRERLIKEENKKAQFRFVRLDDNRFYNKYRSVRSVYAPKNYKKFLRSFLLVTTLALSFIALTPWQQTSSGEGRVMALDPNHREQFITATVSGRIEEWLVQDGQAVKAGDPIVKVIDNDPNFLNRLEGARDAALKKFEAAKAARETGLLNYDRQQKLVEQGLSSRKEYEAAKISYKKLLAEEAAASALLQKAEVDLSRQQLQMVRAPRDGRIIKVLHGSGMVNIKEGEKLVHFIPDANDLVVELFVDGNDLPLVQPGREVRLQFEGWPAVQFSGWPSVAVGSFGGLVTTVDPFVNEKGEFRVLIKPDPRDLVHWPEQNILRQGTRAVGLVLLEPVSIGYEVWRKINGFPKSMNDVPDLLKRKQ